MLNIIGETMIFKSKSGNGYYTSISNKLADGSYDKNFITVGFRKNVEVNNFTKININNGFLTHYTITNQETEEKTKRDKIMILDFEVLQEYSNDNSNEEDIFLSNDDDLPF